jgi:hypothetical protein
MPAKSLGRLVVLPALFVLFMRSWISAFAVAAALLATPAALAAPTCQDKNGETIRCGTAGAMPVGWTLSPQQRLERQISKPKYPSTNELLELIGVMGVFFTLLALMPEFDGQTASDWGEQEGDCEEPE